MSRSLSSSIPSGCHSGGPMCGTGALPGQLPVKASGFTGRYVSERLTPLRAGRRYHVCQRALSARWRFLLPPPTPSSCIDT
ncbi:hypothetical protein SCOCK_200092 [Actinacidiphila cocklensis]|uniref:Uncharacterized protein n=1 Tax=Actinacidiphila cocklensis TaxID=887465 RepID=A0A9W4GSC4_9ACTN|nr:hypothetical protein SCOCK_200092 [Actinacidiphila cocklensis]